MSRLFIIVNSDGRSSPERIMSHEHNDIEVRWGSAKDSKLLYKAHVVFLKGEEQPGLWIDIDESITAVHIDKVPNKKRK